MKTPNSHLLMFELSNVSRFTSRMAFCSALAISCILAPASRAANETWSTTPTSNAWNLNGNWTDGTKPLANDVLFFGNSSTTSLNNDYTANTQFNGLTFNSGADAFILGGNAIALNGNITNSSANLQTIGFNMSSVSSAVRTFTTTAGGGDILFSGNLTSGGIATTGTGGTLILTGNNSAATNVVTVTNNTLRVSAANNFTAGTLTLQTATLDMRNDVGVNFAKNIILNRSSPTFVFNVDRAEGGVGAYQTHTIGNLSMASNASPNPLNITVTGANGYGLTMGSLSLTGYSSAQTWNITNNAPGLLTMGSLLSDHGTTNFNVSSLVFAGTGNITTGALTDTGAGSAVYNVTKNGANTLSITGTGNYKGTTSVAVGTLLVDGDYSAATGNLSVSANATLGGSGTIGGATTIANSGILAPGTTGDSTSTLTLNSKNLTISGADSKINLDITGTAAGTFDNIIGISTFAQNGDLTFSIIGSYGNGTPTTWDVFDFTGKSGNFDTITLVGDYSGTLTRSGEIWTNSDIGGNRWEFDQTSGILFAIPEPATWALLALSLVALLTVRRRLII